MTMTRFIRHGWRRPRLAALATLCCLAGAARADDRLVRFHDRVREKASRHDAAPVLIVALGDSVTQGFTTLGHLEPKTCYHRRLQRLLEAREPKTVFSTINAGAGGETAARGLRRVQRDVVRHQPDLVLIAYGLNDTGAGLDGIGPFRQALDQMVESVMTGTEAAIILLTPNWMNTRTNERVNVAQAELAGRFAERQNGGVVAAYAEAIRAVGRSHRVPVADVYAAWEAYAANGGDTDAWLANGLNHPVAEAHRIPAEQIMAILDPGFAPSFHERIPTVHADNKTQ